MTETLTPIERAAIGWECERLIHLYSMLNDAGDFHAVAELFTDDGVFVRPSGGVETKGREAILAMYLSRPPRFTRHMITSVVITPEGPDSAAGHSYLSLHTAALAETLPAPADPVYLIGAFHDRFVRQAGVWRFSERRGSLSLKVGG